MTTVLEGIINDPDDKFRYGMLSRWKADMHYYYGYGNRHDNQLWTTVPRLIDYIKELYISFPDDKKPEWLSMDEINRYYEYLDKPGYVINENGTFTNDPDNMIIRSLKDMGLMA